MPLRLLSLLVVVLLVGCEKNSVRSEAVTPGTSPEAPTAAKPADPPPADPEPADPSSDPPSTNSGEATCDGYVAGSADVPRSLLDCATDDDCTLAQITCCPCSSNGRRAAVAKAHASCIKPEAGCPEHMVCSSAYVCDDYRVECKDKVCTQISLNEPVKIEMGLD